MQERTRSLSKLSDCVCNRCYENSDMVEEGRIYGFFAGLNSEFDQVRVQILGKEPLPSLQEAFAYV